MKHHAAHPPPYPSPIAATLTALAPLLAAACLAQTTSAPTLHLTFPNATPTPESTSHPGHRLVLDHSPDLARWTETARTLDQLHPYPDLSPPTHAAGFYRLHLAPTLPDDDWSNQLVATSPALFLTGTGSGLAATPTAKWAILLDRPDRVYFQDSAKYPYHLQFARARLPGYAGIGALEFAARSLHPGPAQQLAVGSVLRAPDPQVRELAIEVTGAEAFPAATAAGWAEAVKRRLVAGPGWRTFYMPSAEQLAETLAHPDLFAARGLPVASLDRWADANSCYSPGWALGRLVQLPSNEIAAALADGRLTFTDILVTDLVPAELPVLAGYLCLAPATPNSHVALLARSLLLPFAHAGGAGLQAELASLAGREVLLVVEDADGTCRITLQDTTGLLTQERRREILASKTGGPLDLTPTATAGCYTLPADPLTPADLRFVGGKAANFGFLRRSLPADSPHPALALTFDLWHDYLAQTLPGTGGRSLRAFIDERLSNHIYPPEVAALRADLAAIRNAVEKTADFSAAQRAAIIAALQAAGLHGAKIRFRSSTNVEDAESFSGAGLYDSFSGCLEDDTDGDDLGPSHCDPAEPNERGVFRAIRKVYASFYNENAVLERLRHGVDESAVGMAVLVHFSVPDPTELANGVATLAIDKSGATRTASARIVSQLGAESVTNPDVTIRPEIVSAHWHGQDTNAATLALDETSTLTQNGAPVMTWDADYRTLVQQLNTATLAYEQYYPANTTFELDFEYKRVAPGHVGLKQLRAVPHPTSVPPPVIP